MGWEKSGDPGCSRVRLLRFNSGSPATWLADHEEITSPLGVCFSFLIFFFFFFNSFLICDMRIVLVSASGGYSEDDILKGT